MNRHASPLAQAFRKATLQAHHTLDHHPILAPLVSPALTRAQYTKALAALHGPQSFLENLLRGTVPAHLFPPRLPALDTDLLTLQAAPFPLAVLPPAFHSLSEKIGALYVLEGSNLGAQVIAKQLQITLSPELPRHFFSQSEGQVRWQRFWQWVGEADGSDKVDDTAATTAALDTFTFFRDHLDALSSAPEISVI